MPPGLGDSEGRVRNGVVLPLSIFSAVEGRPTLLSPTCHSFLGLSGGSEALEPAVPKLVSILVENSPGSSHGAGKSAWRGSGPGARGGRLLFRAIKAFTMSAGIPS